MKIRVQDIPDLGMEVVADTSTDPWWREAVHEVFATRWQADDPAQLEARLVRSEEMVSLNADINASIHPQCDRCLTTFERPYHIHIQHYLIPAGSEEKHDKRGRERELDEEDLEFGTYEGQTIQLGEILREQMVLELPYQFLCRPDCQGLCPHCGINRNESQCSCHEESHLSPFAVLKSLKS